MNKYKSIVNLEEEMHTYEVDFESGLIPYDSIYRL